MDNNVKEVKRPAKVGEYIKIVDKHFLENEYKNGDIFKVVELEGSENVYVDKLRKDTNNNILVLYSEYIVLEGYDEECNIIYTPDNVELVVPAHNPLVYDIQKALYDRLLKGNDDMNKVLKLYYDRKYDEINRKYEETIENEFNNIDIVKKYNELIENFEKEQEKLFKNTENLDNDYLIETGEKNNYKYSIDSSHIRIKLQNKYNDDYSKEIDTLNELRDEVDAQLSLSEDLGYQIEVLSNYGIIDKKNGNKLKA